MGFKLKRALAALGVAACVAVPVLADTSWHSNAVSGGGSVSTTAVTKKSSATGAPALVQFTEFTNYDANPSAHPLALRVRTPAGAVATGVVSVYGTGTYTLYYNSGYGIYGDYYVANIATHSASKRGASFTLTFTP